MAVADTFDLMLRYNEREPVEWVMRQVEARGGRAIFGARVEGQGISLFKWTNGVYSIMMRGQDMEDRCRHRLISTRDVIEVGVRDGPAVLLVTEYGHGCRLWIQHKARSF